MNPMKFFWGITIALLGFALLGVQEGWVDESIWLKIVYLWPIILIVWGLSLIIKNKKSMVAIILLIIALAILFISTNSGLEYRIMNINGSVELSGNALDSIDLNARKVELNLGASRIRLGSLSEAQSETNLLEYEGKGYSEIIIEPLDISNKLDSVKISEKGPEFFLFTTFKRELDLDINKSLPVELELNCGASVLELDLEDLRVVKLDFKSGANTATVTFGNRERNVDVNVDSGASNIVFNIPSDSGVKLNFLSGKITNNLTDNIGLDNNGNIYLSPNYPFAKNKISIDVKSGVSNITLNTY